MCCLIFAVVWHVEGLKTTGSSNTVLGDCKYQNIQAVPTRSYSKSELLFETFGLHFRRKKLAVEVTTHINNLCRSAEMCL